MTYIKAKMVVSNGRSDPAMSATDRRDAGLPSGVSFDHKHLAPITYIDESEENTHDDARVGIGFMRFTNDQRERRGDRVSIQSNRVLVVEDITNDSQQGTLWLEATTTIPTTLGCRPRHLDTPFASTACSRSETAKSIATKFGPNQPMDYYDCR
jgi:hypothetical protein